MKKTSIRWLSFLMALIMCLSLLIMPAAADEAGAETGTETTDTTADSDAIDGSAQITETEEVPQVNVIEVPEEEPEQEPEQEPAAEPEQTPAEQTADAEEAAVEDDASGEPAQDGVTTYTVSYYYGTDMLFQETVEEGKSPVQAPVITSGGTAIAGWTDLNGVSADLSKLVINADIDLYAWCKPELETTEHNSYINGMTDTLFSPNGTLTRGQAAQLLYNLLKTKECGPLACEFTDVTPAKWYYTAITVLASYGILNGYTDSEGTVTFKPEQSITRAEFVTILVRLTGISGGDVTFSDISTHWAAASIKAAASNGWVNGYEDGLFHPNSGVTRAEAVTILNRAMGRTPDQNAIDSATGNDKFTDVPTTHWAYYYIMEACITHTYTTASTTETWSEYPHETIEGSGLTKIDGVTYYVKDNKKTKLVAGINKVDEGFVYAASDGYAVTAEMITVSNTATFTDGTTASQTLVNGFNRVGTTLFYWDTTAKAATYLKAGVNILPVSSTVGYYANTAGYNIRNDFTSGVVELNGKLYISDGYCGIYVKGQGYSSATSSLTTVSLANHLFEYKNGSSVSAMYYVQSDYSLLQNGWYTHLYFGSDGKYTTTDSTLDGYVNNVILNYVGIDNNVTSQVDKLLKAYYYLRGGSGTSWSSSSSNFHYRQLSHGFVTVRANAQTMYAWQITAAKYMFANKCGMCYEWCSAYLFLARRLGFDAYSIVGQVFQSRARHNWCMIKWNNTWHLSDVELEWGYISGYYDYNQHIYWNLFDMAVSSEYFSYYQNPECSTIKYYFTAGI